LLVDVATARAAAAKLSFGWPPALVSAIAAVAFSSAAPCVAARRDNLCGGRRRAAYSGVVVSNDERAHERVPYRRVRTDVAAPLHTLAAGPQPVVVTRTAGAHAGRIRAVATEHSGVRRCCVRRVWRRWWRAPRGAAALRRHVACSCRRACRPMPPRPCRAARMCTSPSAAAGAAAPPRAARPPRRLGAPWSRRSCFYCDFPIQVVGDNTRGAAVSGAAARLARQARPA
jgi:hypothetical protein